MTYPLVRPYTFPIYSMSASLPTSLLSTGSGVPSPFVFMISLFSDLSLLSLALFLSCTTPIQVFVLSLRSLSRFSLTVSLLSHCLASLSLSFSPVRYPSRCSYYLCVHCLSLSLSLSLLYDIHLGVRTIFVFTVSLLSLSLVFMISLLSLCLSCLYRLSAFVFLDIHSFIHTGCLFRGGLEPHTY